MASRILCVTWYIVHAVCVSCYSTDPVNTGSTNIDNEVAARETSSCVAVPQFIKEDTMDKALPPSTLLHSTTFCPTKRERTTEKSRGEGRVLL